MNPSFEEMTANGNDLQPPQMAGKNGSHGKALSRFSTVRISILLVGFVVAILCFVFFVARHSEIRGKFPERFSDGPNQSNQK